MKVNEIIYSILDLSKAASSDDSWVTEELVFFLCKKYRSFLIKKEKDKEKSSKDTAPESEYQELCLDLERVPAIDGEPCTGGYYLRTTKPIPKLMEGYQPKVYPVDYYQGTHINYISRNRMRYIGSNPYTKNIIYCSLAPNMHLYFNSSNEQFLYLCKIRISALFNDFDEAAELSCDENGEVCDIMQMEFPIREHLIPVLIDLVVKEIVGAKIQPADVKNNAKDDVSGEAISR